MHQLISELQFLGGVALDVDIVGNRADRIPETNDGAGDRERRSVAPFADHRTAPNPSLADGGRDVRADAVEAAVEEVAVSEPGEPLARIADRPDERVVGVLECAVRARDQNQVAGLLGCGGQQSHARAGPFQFAALRRKTKGQQPETGNCHHARQQRAKRVVCDTERLEIQRAVANERNQKDGDRGYERVKRGRRCLDRIGLGRRRGAASAAAV